MYDFFQILVINRLLLGIFDVDSATHRGENKFVGTYRVLHYECRVETDRRCASSGVRRAPRVEWSAQSAARLVECAERRASNGARRTPRVEWSVHSTAR